MLPVDFVYLGAVIFAVGQAFYVVDTIRGRTRPNRVTWLMWAAAPLLAFAVETSDGVGLQSLMTFMVGFGPLVVFVASFVNKKAVWQLVGEPEADAKKGKISITSPLARALVGKKKGVQVEVVTPGGAKAYEVMKVEWK